MNSKVLLIASAVLILAVLAFAYLQFQKSSSTQQIVSPSSLQEELNNSKNTSSASSLPSNAASARLEVERKEPKERVEVKGEPIDLTPLEYKEDFGKVPWEFNGETWTLQGNAPQCPEPLAMQLPVDLNLITTVLYPGQYRGNNYKPHGGFAFDNSRNEDVIVKAPMDGYLVKASRYIESSQLQHFLVFINQCGVMYKLDHLVKLSPKIQKEIDALPQPKVDDSRTTNFQSSILVKAGEVIATSVGLSGNVFLDFGVMDLRKTNAASKDSAWLEKRRQEGDFEYAPYGTCWFDFFGKENEAKLKSLPARDSQSGKASDYCE